MNEGQHRDLLAKLVQLDTVGGHEERTAHFLDEYLTEHQIDHQLLKVSPGRFNVIAEIGDHTKPVLAFEGHQDVVGLGDESKWQHQPLGAEVEHGRMYGRGTSDMKSGLAAEIIAMIELSAQPDFHGHVRLLATVGEETSEVNHMQGAQYFADHGDVDDVTGVIVAEPSSVPLTWLTQQPIVNPYRFSADQIQTLTTANQNHEQFVLNFAHKGSITYAVSALGKAAHSSTPELGINAVDALIDFAQKQRQYFATLTTNNEVLGRTLAVTTRFRGGDQLNSVPANAVLYVKVRTIPEVANDDIITAVKELIQQQNDAGGAQLSFELLGNKLPVQSQSDDKLIQLLKQFGEQELQQQLPLGGSTGGTDASELIRANPKMTVAVFGPGNMTAHQTDEYVDLTIYEQFIRLYEKTIKAYFA